MNSGGVINPTALLQRFNKETKLFHFGHITEVCIGDKLIATFPGASNLQHARIHKRRVLEAIAGVIHMAANSPAKTKTLRVKGGQQQ